LGNNINSNNILEVLIAGVKLTPRVKYVSKCEGDRRVKYDVQADDIVFSAFDASSFLSV